MKIALDNGGSYLEPDEGPRDTPYHKRIVRVEPIPGRPAGNNVTLECGHGVETVGNLKYAGGVVLCTKCRDLDEHIMLIVMRVENMHKTHPRADYSHKCHRCAEPVGIYPSGQKALREHPDLEIVCEVCGGCEILTASLEILPGADQERRESFDFTKKKQ